MMVTTTTFEEFSADMGMGIPDLVRDAAMTFQRCQTFNVFFEGFPIHIGEDERNDYLRDVEEKYMDDMSLPNFKAVMDVIRSTCADNPTTLLSMGDSKWIIGMDDLRMYECYLKYGLVVILHNDIVVVSFPYDDFVINISAMQVFVQHAAAIVRHDPYRYDHRFLDGGMDNGEDVNFSFDGKDFCVQIYNGKMYCVCKTTEVIIYSKLVDYNEIEPLSLSHFIGESIQYYLSNPHCIFHALNGGMNFVDYEEKVFDANQAYVENLGFIDEDVKDEPCLIFDDEKSLDGFIDNLVLDDKERELDAMLDVALCDPEVAKIVVHSKETSYHT